MYGQIGRGRRYVSLFIRAHRKRRAGRGSRNCEKERKREEREREREKDATTCECVTTRATRDGPVIAAIPIQGAVAARHVARVRQDKVEVQNVVAGPTCTASQSSAGAPAPSAHGRTPLWRAHPFALHSAAETHGGGSTRGSRATSALKRVVSLGWLVVCLLNGLSSLRCGWSTSAKRARQRRGSKSVSALTA